MANNNNNDFPILLTGLYPNKFAETFVLDTPPLTQERADEICAAVQQAVGGKLEVREWAGKSKSGKDLPGYKLEAITATQLASRKAYGAQRKAQRATGSRTISAGDDAL